MRQEGGSDIELRPALARDAEAIIQVHFAAVHETAAAHYPVEVLRSWSPPPGHARYQQVRDAISKADELLIVAEEKSEVVGFGSIVPRLSELRAVYVHSKAGRRGVGSKILAQLEAMARGCGLSQLSMDASINAEAFYRNKGYSVLQHATHRLGSGQEMACVKMVKVLT